LGVEDRLVAGNVLGVNGLGRIGKLTVWYHLLRGHFQGFVVNLGRSAGGSLEDVLDLLGTDSTYGPVEQFLLGVTAERSLRVVSEEDGLVEVLGVPIRILRESRDPAQLDWRRHGVRTVVDTTGAFLDPVDDQPSGTLRGHLASGARVVLASAPFKVKTGQPLPSDSAMLIYGINHTTFEPHRHRVVSAASCTTTALAHMLLPLLEAEPPANILTASLSTIHAATGTQSVLDSVPRAGARDLRRNRATFDNLLVSSTGAAQALEHVLPAISGVGFLADSVRIPTRTVSLINLNLTLHEQIGPDGQHRFSRQSINGLYRAAAAGPQRGLLEVSDRQNVSSDFRGRHAAVVIEGIETHTRVGFIEIPVEALRAQGIDAPGPLRVPVTHAKVFGWYDNEYGSYVYSLGELTRYIDGCLA
jgi:glyceraldehyde 3-phosphate dehydrogenase